jgi:hypothetical protein
LARLLSLSLNLRTNEMDAGFLRRADNAGGTPEIAYVLDHTVLEMFLALDDETRKYPAAFHLEEWRETSKQRLGRSLEALWSSINRQTAIVTSEYLLSGELPGQADGQIYLSSGHYEEFCNAVERRREEAIRHHGGTDDRIEEIVAAARTGPTSSLNDIYLEPDLSLLFGSDQSQPDAVEFTMTRRWAALLSEQEEALRIFQIQRATSADFLDRIVPVSLRFPLPPAGLPKLEGWRETLEVMDSLGSNRQQRRPGNLALDARTVQHVQWIARTQLGPHQRVVYVTGDPLILQAYAKWHKERVIRDPAEPRVVRSIQQFAPILNAGGMRAGLQNARKIFDMLRETVETPLIAFNLSDPGATREGREVVDILESEVETIRHSTRSDLILRFDGFESYSPIADFFAPRLDADWHSVNGRNFADSARSLRWFERLAIGLNSRFVQKRIERFLDQVDRWSDDTPIQKERQLVIERLLEATARQAVDLWFPVALESLSRGRMRAPGFARVPNSLQLRAPATSLGDSSTLVDLVERWLSDQDIPKELTSEAFRAERHLVFATAAIAGIRIGRWKQARRFAELAVSAAEFRTPARSVTESGAVQDKPFFQELRYLRALCCRLLMGALEPVDLLGEDVWGVLLDQGLADLALCAEFHGARQEVRERLRAKSEAIALRGFYAAWTPVLMKKLSSAATTHQSASGYSMTRASREYSELVAELREALDLLTTARGDALPDHSLLEIQLHANVAAAYSLTQVAGGFDMAAFHQHLDQDHLDMTIGWWRTRFTTEPVEKILFPLPPLVRLQLAVFLRDFAPDIPMSLNAPSDIRTPPLSLDEKLGELLVEQLVLADSINEL